MISVYKGRATAKGRIPTVGAKRATEQVRTYSSFTGGLNLARARFGEADNSLLVADNVIVSPRGLSTRSGSKKATTAPTGQTINRLIPYQGGEQIYAITDQSIFLVQETMDPTAAATPVANLSIPKASSLEMQNAAGAFLTLVNGADPMIIYNGSTWQQVDENSSPLSLTGVSSRNLSFGWVHQRRQYFCQAGELDAWYLGVDSISGVATKLPLGSIFRQSSELLFGASFSTDSGAGLDDFNVFVTKEGEVAVYQGNNPGDANSFSLKGLYKIPTPLGKDAHFNLGGDVVVLTTEGLIPISAALTKDVGQLSLYSLSANIDEDLALQIYLSRGAPDRHWRVLSSPSHNLTFLVSPQYGQPEREVYVVNQDTNGWSKFTGWKVVDMATQGDNLFYTDGQAVYQALTTGRDDGNPIPYTVVTAFTDFGADGREKRVHKARMIIRTEFDVNASVNVERDLEVKPRVGPAASSTTVAGAAEYNQAMYGTDKYAQTIFDLKTQTVERTLYALCNSAAVQCQFSSDGASPLRSYIVGGGVSVTIGANFS